MTETHVHAPPADETEPQGDLCTRTLAMPADTNQNGDIFGGWLLSQMDIGGGVYAAKITKTRNVTVAIDAINFRKPVNVGDLVSVHAKLVRIGRTSITVKVNVECERWGSGRGERVKVTEAEVVLVAVDQSGRPTAVLG